MVLALVVSSSAWNNHIGNFDILLSSDKSLTVPLLAIATEAVNRLGFSNKNLKVNPPPIDAPVKYILLESTFPSAISLFISSS
ncbi:hypothetical protein D3C81_669100 [compost metagenome]